MDVLDSRYKAKLSKTGNTTAPKKRIGAPSKSHPPDNFVDWAVKSEWHATTAGLTEK